MLTPLDIQQKEFRRSLRGYSRREVDAFVSQVLQDYENIYVENQRLRERLEEHELMMSRYREMENIIKDTMLMAQKSAEELKRAAEKEAELLLQGARQQADQILREAEDRAQALVKAAEENAGRIIEEARAQVRAILDEYRHLEKQAHVFRARFRSLLEAQLKLLDGQEDEVMKPLREVLTEVAGTSLPAEGGAAPSAQKVEDADDRDPKPASVAVDGAP